MVKLGRIILLGWLLCFAAHAEAKTVRLITIGPGDAFWSAFGHTAIAIDDDVYGFGYFSFQDDVISQFIENRMQYELGLSEINYELNLAKRQNRDFSVLEVDMSDVALIELENHLKWHNLPANQSYSYDYFFKNCSTKVRDLINNAWHNELFEASQELVNDSFFEQTFPAKHQALMNFGLAMGYGWSAYQDRSAWELMAFPVLLEQHVSQLDASSRIKSHQLIYAATAEHPMVSFFLTHWALLSYLLFWLILMLWSKTQVKTADIWFKWHALLGVLLLGLWFLTPHQVADWNFNVMLFTPLGFWINQNRLMQLVVFISYLAWFGVSLYLSAWYLVPLLLLGMMALQIKRRNLSFN